MAAWPPLPVVVLLSSQQHALPTFCISSCSLPLICATVSVPSQCRKTVCGGAPRWTGRLGRGVLQGHRGLLHARHALHCLQKLTIFSRFTRTYMLCRQGEGERGCVASTPPAGSAANACGAGALVALWNCGLYRSSCALLHSPCCRSLPPAPQGLTEKGGRLRKRA